MEMTMVVKIINELRSVSRLRIFPETGKSQSLWLHKLGPGYIQ